MSLDVRSLGAFLGALSEIVDEENKASNPRK
jgi:hypothetical protein